MSDRMPVTGPHRVYLRRTPTGVELDVSHLVGQMLVQLASDFSEDPSGVAAELEEIAGAAAAATMQTSHGSDDAPASHERDALVDDLLEQIGGTRVVVTGGQVADLGRALLGCAPAAAVQGGRAAA